MDLQRSDQTRDSTRSAHSAGNSAQPLINDLAQERPASPSKSSESHKSSENRKKPFRKILAEISKAFLINLFILLIYVLMLYSLQWILFKFPSDCAISHDLSWRVIESNITQIDMVHDNPKYWGRNKGIPGCISAYAVAKEMGMKVDPETICPEQLKLYVTAENVVQRMRLAMESCDESLRLHLSLFALSDPGEVLRLNHWSAPTRASVCRFAVECVLLMNLVFAAACYLAKFVLGIGNDIIGYMFPYGLSRSRVMRRPAEVRAVVLKRWRTSEAQIDAEKPINPPDSARSAEEGDFPKAAADFRPNPVYPRILQHQESTESHSSQIYCSPRPRRICSKFSAIFCTVLCILITVFQFNQIRRFAGPMIALNEQFAQTYAPDYDLNPFRGPFLDHRLFFPIPMTNLL